MYDGAFISLCLLCDSSLSVYQLLSLHNKPAQTYFFNESFTPWIFYLFLFTTGSLQLPCSGFCFCLVSYF